MLRVAWHTKLAHRGVRSDCQTARNCVQHDRRDRDLESQRAITHQTQSTDDLRTRTGALLAASGVIVAFFSPVALGDGIGPAAVFALPIYAVVAALCIWVLLPRFASEHGANKKKG
jgi:hypothetical protein